WLSYDTPELALPRRGGFRDVWSAADTGLLYVIDGVSDELWALDQRGVSLARTPLPAAPYRLGPAKDALWVLAFTQPKLSLLALDARGMPGRTLAAVDLEAPIRDAVYDASRATLWAVG